MATVTPILGKGTRRYTDQSLTQMNYFVDRERKFSKASPTRFLSRPIPESNAFTAYCQTGDHPKKGIGMGIDMGMGALSAVGDILNRSTDEDEEEEEDEGDEGGRPVIDIENDDEATTSSGNSSTQSDFVFSPDSESQSISQTSCSLLKDSESESESDSSSGGSTTSLELSEHEI